VWRYRTHAAPLDPISRRACKLPWWTSYGRTGSRSPTSASARDRRWCSLVAAAARRLGRRVHGRGLGRAGGGPLLGRPCRFQRGGLCELPCGADRGARARLGARRRPPGVALSYRSSTATIPGWSRPSSSLIPTPAGKGRCPRRRHALGLRACVGRLRRRRGNSIPPLPGCSPETRRSSFSRYSRRSPPPSALRASGHSCP
jgi:hypothetical protein